MALNHLELASLFTLETAGFKQCMSQLASYMHRITPAQRTSLIERLKHHTENPDLEQKLGENPASLDTSCSSERKEDSLKFPFLCHSFGQPLSCSTPHHDYLSPPHSPWFSPLSTYSTSPPFPSVTYHFTFPPSVSPPSSNSSFSTLPPVSFTPTAGLYLPLQPPPRGVSSASASLWRPW